MNIRARVLVSAALAIAATLACAVMLAIGASRSLAADEEQEKVQVTSRAIANLLILTQDYALHSEVRAAQQWREEHASLARALSAAVQSGETSAARLALREAAAELPALFARLTELAAADSPLAERGKELVADQLLTRTQVLADGAYRWSREAAAAEQSARRGLRIGGAAALLLLLLTTLAQPIVVWRRVIRPLSVLEATAARIERGDLGARCASSARDELGRASRRFDAMTAALAERSALLQRSEQRLRAITDNLPVLIAYVDAEQRYRFCNATYEQWFGVSAAETEGRRVAEVLGEAVYAERRESIERALAGERVESEQLLRLPGGDRHLHALYIPHQEDGKTLGFYALVTDVTEIKQSEAELMRLARFDTLTGLPNRRQFDERLHEAMARARRMRRPMALLFLDIDRFKSINDSLGHVAGDAVLKEFGRRLKETVRITDTVARLAGDEFVVILEAIHASADAEQVAHKIVTAVREAFDLDGQPLLLTTSIGIAIFEGDDAAPAELMARADAALYETKSQGRNNWRLHRTARQSA